MNKGSRSDCASQLKSTGGEKEKENCRRAASSLYLRV